MGKEPVLNGHAATPLIESTPVNEATDHGSPCGGGA
jgi:hypothetical protein